jgi:hypothetical protein
VRTTSAAVRRKGIHLGGSPSFVSLESMAGFLATNTTVVHYSSGSFAADISFDGNGFVTLYGDFLERV